MSIKQGIAPPLQQVLMEGALLGGHHPMAGERGQVVDGEVPRPFGFIGFAQQLAAGHLAQEESLVRVGQLGRMKVL